MGAIFLEKRRTIPGGLVRLHKFQNRIECSNLVLVGNGDKSGCIMACAVAAMGGGGHVAQRACQCIIDVGCGKRVLNLDKSFAISGLQTFQTHLSTAQILSQEISAPRFRQFTVSVRTPQTQFLDSSNVNSGKLNANRSTIPILFFDISN